MDSVVARREFQDLDALEAGVGEEFGPSDWHEVTQERVDAFAAATGDRFWIHVDPVRAAGSDMGGTIAHGLYTLSLGPQLSYSIVSFERFAVVLNYGFERVRFPSPLPVGSRVRMRSQLVHVRRTGAVANASLLQTFERENAEKPVCIATSIVRLGE
jgi:acyl dehydratase